MGKIKSLEHIKILQSSHINNIYSIIIQQNQEYIDTTKGNLHYQFQSTTNEFKCLPDKQQKGID